MKKFDFMLSMIAIVIAFFVIANPVSATLIDNFEGYAAGSFPSANWVPDGNAKTDTGRNAVMLDPTDSSNKVLGMYGITNAYWAALAYHEYDFPKDYTIEAKVYNGTEVFTSGHQSRAYIGMRYGTYWYGVTNPARMLILFNNENEIIGSDSSVIGTYTPGRWYNVKIRYQEINNTSNSSYWLDDVYIGEVTTILHDSTLALPPNHLDFTAQAGTVYFDDINVYDNTIPEPGTILLFGFGLLGITSMNRRKR